MNDKILRVGIMCRVSTDEQALHGDSLEAQETTLVEYANTNNMKIYKIYRDAGFSARKAVLKRPAMLELIKDIESGKLDIVIFTKLDRWFRNIKEYYKIQDILDRNKVVWKSILEDYNTATADGRLKVNIMLSVAENEADRTSERIKFVFQSKIAKKEVIIAPHCVPFGYKVETIDGIRRLVKNEEQREATEFFFNAVSYTSTRQAIIQTENKFNIHRECKSWYTMCKNELYTGTYKGVEDYCEPYITKRQFNEMNKDDKKFREAKERRTYLFSGLIHCPHCGRLMTSKFCRGNGGVEYYYYRCPNSITKQCSVRILSERRAEEYVMDNVRKELESFILYHESSGVKQKKTVNNVEKLKEKLRRVNVSYHAGNMEDSEYLAKTKEIKALIDKAMIEEQQESTIDLTSLKDFLHSDFETLYTTLDKKEKQVLWRSVINELVYNGNSVTGIKFKA